jgi:hypothetical protein
MGSLRAAGKYCPLPVPRARRRRWPVPFLRALAAAGVLLLTSLIGLASSSMTPAAAATSPAATSPAATSPAGAATPTATTKQATTTSLKDTAYWMDATNGALYSFGGAPNYGTMAGKHLNEPMVGMATMPTGHGYWMVAADGGIFTFGNAQFYGSTGNMRLNKPIVGMAAMPTGHGYWLVASDGGIFTFGSAQFYGSMGNKPLNKPIVGMAATQTGQGYWLVASDGGIFTFGNAQFYGSTGGTQLSAPIHGMATMPKGTGYWLISTSGAIYPFGSAKTHLYGSLASQSLRSPIVGMTANYTGTGYWLASASGAVVNFGTTEYWGSVPSGATKTVVGIGTAVGNGDPGSPSFQAGSYGYDVSNYQCTRTLPTSHAIGIVEVTGWSYYPVNPCLANEVTWAAGGLNLYTFISYGTTVTQTEPGCTKSATVTTPTECDYGYGAAMHSYNEAVAVLGKTRTNVPWWLDVEPDGGWSTTTGKNRSLVIGAFDALHYGAGINTVGFYFSPDNWSKIVGNYNPPAPLYVAWYNTATPSNSCNMVRTVATGYIPTGPIELLQYTDNANGMNIDGDYACA